MMGASQEGTQMKYAIISDVHGNMPALKLVLEDAKRKGADGYLLAGDYSIRAPWFNEVIPALRRLPNMRAVCGNEEKYLHLPKGNDAQFAICYWAASRMHPDNLAWLDSLPARLDWEMDGTNVHMAHHMDVFLGKEISSQFRTTLLSLHYPERPVSNERFLRDSRELLSSHPDFSARLAELPEGIYIYGHNHAQAHARFGNHLFINPGSCGQPLDCRNFAACYTLLTIENGEWRVEERRIPYDPKPLIEQVKQSEQYAAAPVWTNLVFLDWTTASEHMVYFLRYAEAYAKRIGDSRRPFMRDTFQAAFDEWEREGYPLLQEDEQQDLRTGCRMEKNHPSSERGISL